MIDFTEYVPDLQLVGALLAAPVARRATTGLPTLSCRPAADGRGQQRPYGRGRISGHERLGHHFLGW